MAQTERFVPRYHDLKIRIVAAFAGAYIVARYGGDDTLLSLLLTPVFYIEFGATLLITFLIIQIIYLTTVQLDKKVDWHERPWARTLLQLCFGVLLPTLITFLLAAIYFSLYGKNILDTYYHVYALPFIVALISMFNGYYYIRYLLAERARLKALAMLLPLAGRLRPDGVPVEDTNSVKEDQQGPAGLKPKETFIVRTPTRTFPIPTDHIAYFYRTNGNVYLRPFSGGDHLLSQSLDAIEQQLDTRLFFRAARYMIVNYNAIKGYQPLSYGKLGLELHPVFREEVTVSKPMAKSFRSWMER